MKLFLTKCRAETLFKNIEIEKRREKYFPLIFNIEIALAIISDIIRLQELQKEQKKCVHALCQLQKYVLLFILSREIQIFQYYFSKLVKLDSSV